jgi:3-dehydroquinate dehydratase-2
MHIDVVHGPNLNLLGQREPALYGRKTLAEVNAALVALGRELGATVTTFQSNHEGALLDHLAARAGEVDAFILNPAGYTHTSVALRDALLAVQRPFIEVHLSNTDAREPFRRTSLVADIALGRIQGLGPVGYELALRGLVCHLQSENAV